MNFDTPVASNAETSRAIEAHLAQHGFFTTNAVQRAPEEQECVHVTINICPPTIQLPVHTLWTSGMSDQPMPVPSESSDLAYAELVIFLPSNTRAAALSSELLGLDGSTLAIIRGEELGKNEPDDPGLTWAMHWLDQIARHPHATGTWLGSGHLFPTGSTAPIPGTGFTGFILLEPSAVPNEVLTRDGRHIHLYMVVPLYPEELTLCRQRGVPSLIKGFADANISGIADSLRPNVGDNVYKPRSRLL